MPETSHPVNPLRTPHVAAVLDLVRETGRSAFPRRGAPFSDIVLAVAVERGIAPKALQADVFAYADAR